MDFSRIKMNKLTIVFVGGIILLISFFLITLFDALKPTRIIPPPTPVENRPQARPTLGPIQQFSEKIVSNLHWFNNREVAYSFYNGSLQLPEVAKTQGVYEETLLANSQVTLPLYYWAPNNTLLIFNQGDPYRTYIFSPGVRSLVDVGIEGVGFSWSPTSDRVFYRNSQELDRARTLTVATGTSEEIEKDLPLFDTSFWSPNGREILLFNFDPYGENLSGGESKKLYKLTLSSNSVVEITSDIFYPSWSPKGDKISYAKKDGIYVYKNGKEALVYKSAATINQINYAWFDNDNLVVFDSILSVPQFIKVHEGSKKKNQMFTYLKFKQNQNVEIAFSPDKKSVAIASQKNGFWFITDGKF